MSRYIMGLFLSVVFFSFYGVLSAEEYYVSTDGNDTNDGSFSAPFRTVTTLLNALQPGDTGYIRGGTYQLSQITIRSGSEGNPITIKAYDNENVVLKGYGQTGGGGKFRINHDWHVIENLDFYLGSTGVSIKGGSHNTIINCKAHSHYYTGFVISGDGASYNQFKNCDAYDMYDSGGDGGNADGIVVTGHTSAPGPGNSFVGCRSFNNSDDGFDVWKAGHPVRIIECMSFNNGNHNGDGNGFKTGINKTQEDKHVLERCLAWGNRQNGFDYNDNALSQTLYNCIAYNNKRNYKFYAISDIPDIHDLQNCISVIAPSSDILLSSIINNKLNSWNYISRNATNVMENNFISTDDAIISGPRNADGSIPDSDFLKLKETSIFVDKGIYVGMHYNGSAPDLGPFESGTVTPSDKIKMLFLDAANDVNNNVQYMVTGNSTRDNVYNDMINYYTEQFAKINVELIDNACSGQSCKNWISGGGNYDTYLSDAISATYGDGENTIMEFSFGLNDWDIPTVPQLKARFGQAIGLYLDAKPKATVLLVTAVRTNNLSYVNKLRTAYQELSDSLGLPLVDVRTATDGVHGDSRYYYDGTHPNKWGSRRVVNYITDQILPSPLYSVMTLTEASEQSGWMSIAEIYAGLDIRLEKDTEELVTFIGITDVLGSVTTNSTPRACGPFVVSDNCIIDDLNIYHQGDHGNDATLTMAVYADDGDGPGNRIAIIEKIEVDNAAGWQTVLLPTGVNAAKDQKIWIALDFSENPGIRYNLDDAEYDHYFAKNDSLENPFVKGGSMKVDYSLYATYTISTDISAENSSIPGDFSLMNYPNPFNPSTKIAFTLPKISNVKLTVYNVLGEKIKELVNSKMPAGNHEVVFDATHLAGGIYFYRISADNFVLVKKMIYIK